MKPSSRLLSALVVLAGPGFGQQALPPASAAEAPVELLPFLVDASKDVGYQGGNTTSGSMDKFLNNVLSAVVRDNLAPDSRLSGKPLRSAAPDCTALRTAV